MFSASFFAAGLPKGQPRPRAFAFKGSARVFDPGTAEGWKSQVALAAQPHAPREPVAGPLYVNLVFLFPRPKSHSTKKGLRPTAPAYHAGKPDSDNCAKAVLDALTTCGWWKDDAQVVKLLVTKRYADGPPGVSVMVHEAGAGVLRDA